MELEISGIPFTEKEDGRDLITKLVDLANITKFNISQVNVIYRTSKKSTAPIHIMNFYNQQRKVKGLTNPQFSAQ